MSEKTIPIVRRVFQDAANAPNFFDYSDFERLRWLIARAYELGKKARPVTRAKAPPRRRRKAKRRAPNRPHGASVQLTIQLRPHTKSVCSGRRK
jgi:hypothetical protein